MLCAATVMTAATRALVAQVISEQGNGAACVCLDKRTCRLIALAVKHVLAGFTLSQLLLSTACRARRASMLQQVHHLVRPVLLAPPV